MSSAMDSGGCLYALRNFRDAALWLADLSAVEDQIVIVGHAVDPGFSVNAI
jgi:hypothetical protein